MITYNHEKFIAQAIDSILMQKVNFDYEVIIGEDYSTDRTREIVIDFRKRYPDKIRLLLNEKNVGGRKNFIQILKASRGDYIAILEGDDYWTSPNKLQKQVDFLDSHPECAICFHSVKVLYEDGSRESWISLPSGKKEIYTLEDLLEKNLVATLSTMFRKGLFGEFPSWFHLTPVGDWPLHILNAQYGKIGYIDEVMGVYRIHANGVWSSKGLVQNLKGEIETYKFLNSHFNFRYDKFIRSKVSLRYLWIAEAFKQRDDRINALSNLFKCISKSPFNLGISYLRLFVMILDLSSPWLYKKLKGLKNKYLK
jgi:glycosyltransferase involved in cell wall biosynthesis